MCTRNRPSACVDVLDPPTKLDKDKKEYRVIKLGNGLKALLISHAALYGPKTNEGDRKSRKMSTELLAGVALGVDVGSFYDVTVSVPGMAHFCEHMMFLGSKKYPEENAFDKYLNEYGGFSNAFTSSEDTVYYYSITESGLTGSLDRLSALLKAPLLSMETMLREREAVDTEFQERRHNAEHQIEQFIVEMGNYSHPAANFNWGNLQTLKEDISDEELHEKLHQFRKKYYIANRMHLCIQSRLSLNELQDLVVEYFSDIPHNFDENLSLASFGTYTHKNAFKTTFYDDMACVSVKTEETRLFLTWVLPPMLDKYRTKSLYYVKSILLSDNEGSLLEYLTDNTLAYSLDIELDYADFEYNSLFTLFKFDVQLTENGLENLSDVLDAIFSYLLFLKESPISEEYYNFLAAMTKKEFEEIPEQSPDDNVMAIATNMKYYDSKDYLFGTDLFLEFNEDDIREVIGELNKPKFNIFLVSEGCDAEKQEKYFEFGYTDEKLPDYCMKAWKNRAIKEEFAPPEIGEVEKKSHKLFYNSKMKVSPYPKKIFDGVICEAWYRIDDKFSTPLCEVHINFVSPLPMKSLENYVLQRLHYHVYDHATDQIEYPDSVHGAEYQISTHFKGLSLKVTGHYKPVQGLIKILTKSLKELASSFDEEVFEQCKEALKKSCQENLTDAGDISTELLDNLLDTHHQLEADVIKVTDDITYEMMTSFAKKFSRRLHIQVLAQGNILRTTASTIVKDVLTSMNCVGIRDKSFLDSKTRKIPIGKRHIQSKALVPQNSAITNYYQIGEQTISSKCLLDLLILIIKEPLYFVLRTREQLAYSVSEEIVQHNNIIGFTITVASKEDKNPAVYVDEKTSDFIRREVKEILQNLTDEKFQTFRDTQIRLKKLMDLELSTEVQRNFEEITSEEYLFDRSEKEIEFLEQVTKQDLLEFYKSHLTPGNTKNISIHVIGPNEEVRLEEKSDDEDENDSDSDNESNLLDTDEKLQEFKRSLEIYPFSKTTL